MRQRGLFYRQELLTARDRALSSTHHATTVTVPEHGSFACDRLAVILDNAYGAWGSWSGDWRPEVAGTLVYRPVPGGVQNSTSRSEALYLSHLPVVCAIRMIMLLRLVVVFWARICLARSSGQHTHCSPCCR